MRRVLRKDLATKTLAYLEAQSKRVQEAKDPSGEVAVRWKRARSTKSFQPVRDELSRMSHGRDRCMYCEDSLGTDIEHFYPKASFPERAFVWDNYLLACRHCNSNQKRDAFPLDAAGQPLLIDPSVDEPRDHLTFSPSTGEFRAKTEKGKASVEVFGLNDTARGPRLADGRRDAVLGLKALLLEFDCALKRGSRVRAEKIRRALRRHPFSSVFVWIIDTSKKRCAKLVLGAEIARIIEEHEVESWLEVS